MVDTVRTVRTRRYYYYLLGIASCLRHARPMHARRGVVWCGVVFVRGQSSESVTKYTHSAALVSLSSRVE